MNWWRTLAHRWRHGYWCRHSEEAGELIDLGRRKRFTCQDCGRVVIV